MVVVLTAATLAFAALHLAPGDAANALAEGTPPAVREHLRRTYALDRPVAEQYARWLLALARGDLGPSLSERRPVVDVLATAIPATLVLAVPAFVLSLVIGMALGVWQAARAGRPADRWTGRVLLVLYSVPEFWLAMTLVLLLARHGPRLPVSGVTSDWYAYLSAGAQVRDRLAHLLLPVLSLTIIGVATVARYQRDSMRAALAQPFVRTATAGGTPRGRVLRQAWRVAVLPVVTLSGLLLPAYVAGVVFVEQVFAWPGVGTMLVRAVGARDYPLVTGAVVVGSLVTAAAAAAADLLREAVDPRLRVRGAPTAPGRA